MIGNTFSSFLVSVWLKWHSQDDIRLALFDSNLDQLKLPVVRAPTAPFLGDHVDLPSGQSPKLEPLSGLVQKYFEWVGTAEEGAYPPIL